MTSEETTALGERIAETAAHLDAAMHRLLTDLRQFDAEGGYYHAGAITCAHWLSWRVGWELGTSREHVRVARALADLPLIDEALRLGQVSYSKVRAMTRVATPQMERLLLHDAMLMTGQQLDKTCRHYAMVRRHDKDPDPRDDRDRRYVRRRDRDDGMVKIEAVMHSDEAAVIWELLNRTVKDLNNGIGPGQEDPDEVPAQTSGDDLRTSDDTHAAASALSIGHVASDDTRSAAHIPEAQDVPAAEASFEAATRDVPAETSGHDRWTRDHANTATRDVPAEASGDDRWMGEQADAPARDVRAELFADVATPDVPAETFVDDLTADRAELATRDVPAETCTSGAAPRAVAVTKAPVRTAAGDNNKQRFDRADALLLLAKRLTAGKHDFTPIEVLLTVPLSALRAGAHEDIRHVGVLPDGDLVQNETARRLSCDAGIVEMIENEHGELHSVGRRRRAIPAAVRRVVLKRDRCCRFPGCTNRLYAENHHMRHWADGGESIPSNLIRLCSWHHRFVHEYKYTIKWDEAGQPLFFDPKGRPAKDVPPPCTTAASGWASIVEANDTLDITADTNEPGWDGEPVEYNEVIYYWGRADDHLLDPRLY